MVGVVRVITGVDGVGRDGHGAVEARKRGHVRRGARAIAQADGRSDAAAHLVVDDLVAALLGDGHACVGRDDQLRADETLACLLLRQRNGRSLERVQGQAVDARVTAAGNAVIVPFQRRGNLALQQAVQRPRIDWRLAERRRLLNVDVRRGPDVGDQFLEKSSRTGLP